MLTRTGAATWFACTVTLLLRAPHATSTLADAGSPSFPVALLETGLLAIAAWAVLALGLCALGGSAGSVASRLVPAALRGLLVVGVGVSLTATAAHAEPDRHERGAPLTVLDGLVLPERPVGGTTSAPLPSGHAPSRPAPDVMPAGGVGGAEAGGGRPTVRVAPGDTLWSIAERHLAADASTSDVARAALQWHEANRDVIGEDPDLVQPGQRLVTPRSVR